MNRHQKNDPVEKYKTYLRLERGLSENTVEAYLDDLKKLFRFADEEQRPILQIEYADLQQSSHSYMTLASPHVHKRASSPASSRSTASSCSKIT